MGELREKIAKLISKESGGNIQYSREFADQILSLFKDWLKQAGYVKLADDQSLPKIEAPDEIIKGMMLGVQQDMLKVQEVNGKRFAFRKVIIEGEI